QRISPHRPDRGGWGLVRVRGVAGGPHGGFPRRIHHGLHGGGPDRRDVPRTPVARWARLRAGAAHRGGSVRGPWAVARTGSRGARGGLIPSRSAELTALRPVSRALIPALDAENDSRVARQ